MAPRMESNSDSQGGTTDQSSDSESDGGGVQTRPPTTTSTGITIMTGTGPKATKLNTLVKRVKNSANQGATRFIKEMEMQAVAVLDTFKEQVWQMTTPLTFAVLTMGSPYVKILHSVAKIFGDPLDPDEFHGSPIGFIGERTENMEPFPIQVEEKWFTKQEKEAVVTISEMETHYEAADPRTFVTVVDASTTEEKEFPKLPILPSFCVSKLVEEKVTSFYLRRFIMDTIENLEDD